MSASAVVPRPDPAKTRRPLADDLTTLRLGGMSCAGCAGRIERAVRDANGVTEAHVNFAAATLGVRVEGGASTLESVAHLVRGMGFEVQTTKPSPAARGESVDGGIDAFAEPEDPTERELIWLEVRLAVAGFFAMTAMLPSIVVYLGAVDASDARALYYLAIASGALTTPVVFFSGWPFISRAIRSVRHLSPGMDLLVASGALSAFSYSVVALARGSSDVYFDTAGGIVTFLLLGRLVERLARKRSVSAVQLLHALSPPFAHLVDDTARTREVATKSVVVGARVEVRPGERIPLDGRVLSGESSVDRSVITGESMPVAIVAGACVEAGALNQVGVIVLEVTRVVGERALDRVAQAVERLLGRRAPMQALADRVAASLTALVLGIAVLVAVLGLFVFDDAALAMNRAVAVLVVACPCALGLATPMAVLVAAGHAASRGVLFRDAETLERAAEVTTVFFDKTGTLTEGQPAVIEVRPNEGYGRVEVLTLAALAERGSEHPIARAICAAAPPSTPTEGTTRVVPGAGTGFRGMDGRRVWVGTRAFLESVGVSGVVDPVTRSTVAHVALESTWIGAIVVSDPLRAGARRAVDALRARGLRLALLTGDRVEVADDIAGAIGIKDVHAACSPNDKARLVEQASRRGEIVAFVGDGLNDGPALAAAEVGIAVEGATDVAAAAAGMALRAGGIERLVEALDLARATRRVMRQNLAWAFAYNALAIPAAIAGLVSPAFAALAMAASSLSVVANSLRLSRLTSRENV